MECNNRERLRILYEGGMHNAMDLHQVTNIPLRTVYNIMTWLQAGTSSGRRPGLRRPPSLGVNDRRRVSAFAYKHPLCQHKTLQTK